MGWLGRMRQTRALLWSVTPDGRWLLVASVYDFDLCTGYGVVPRYHVLPLRAVSRPGAQRSRR